MEVFVSDTNFRLISVLDTFSSFIWTERYWGCGDFEITAPVTPRLLEILKQDYYVQLSGSEYTMIIEKVEISVDSEDGDYLIVSGRSLESLLDRRIVWTRTNLDGKVQDCIKKLLNDAIIEPTDPSRKIPNFFFKETDDPVVTDITFSGQYIGEDLYSVICDICKNKNIGFKVTADLDGVMTFELYAGENRTYSQTNNPYIMFSPNYNNLVSSNYIESKKSLKTVCLVYGEKDDEENNTIKTALATISSGAGEGFNRREMFLDDNSSSSKAGVSVYKYDKVADFPFTGSTSSLYLVHNEETGVCQEYIWKDDDKKYIHTATDTFDKHNDNYILIDKDEVVYKYDRYKNLPESGSDTELYLIGSGTSYSLKTYDSKINGDNKWLTVGTITFVDTSSTYILTDSDDGYIHKFYNNIESLPKNELTNALYLVGSSTACDIYYWDDNNKKYTKLGKIAISNATYLNEIFLKMKKDEFSGRLYSSKDKMPKSGSNTSLYFTPTNNTKTFDMSYWANEYIRIGQFVGVEDTSVLYFTDPSNITFEWYTGVRYFPSTGEKDVIYMDHTGDYSEDYYIWTDKYVKIGAVNYDMRTYIPYLVNTGSIIFHDTYNTADDFPATGEDGGIYTVKESDTRYIYYAWDGNDFLYRRICVSNHDPKDYEDVVTESEYEGYLIQKGSEQLKEHILVKSFEGKLENNYMFKYGIDFFMGDIVQLENGYGSESISRVIELVQSYSNDNYDIYPTFATVEEE